MSASAPTDVLTRTVQHVLVKVDAQGTIRCEPPAVVVTGQDVLICFALQGEHWVFPRCDAVLVTDGGAQFPYPSWTLHAKQAALLDCNSTNNSGSHSYDYTVTVENCHTGERRSLDPKIVNES